MSSLLARTLRGGLAALERLQERPFFTYRKPSADDPDVELSFNITCVEGGEMEEVEVEVGGDVRRVTKALFCQGQKFLTWGETVVNLGDTELTMGDQTGPVPRSGEKIIFPGPDGLLYRIVRVTKGPGNAYLRFDLADPQSSRG